MMPPRVASLMQLHLCVLLMGEDSGTAMEGKQNCWLLDFLPLDATSPATALTLFTGNSVPGGKGLQPQMSAPKQLPRPPSN
jgi:hypothetical protein